VANPVEPETLVEPLAPHDGDAYRHAHPHDLNLAHHFEDLGQQHDSLNLGMWAFLGTEVMFFGGLIVSYMVYRFTSPDVWGAASRHLNVWLATFNTVVLLSSSLTMALAVHAGEVGDRKGQVRNLLLTMALGTLFLMIKGFEYYQEYRDRLIPGPGFSTAALHLKPLQEEESGALGREAKEEAAATRKAASDLSISADEFRARRAQLFFVFYFFMTGLHAAHMIIGLVLLAIMVAMARRGRFTAKYNAPLEMSGLYWHFIDIVWVYLYPLLYLVSLHASH
jgi:cytochrome c oxidase subunit 3